MERDGESQPLREFIDGAQGRFVRAAPLIARVDLQANGLPVGQMLLDRAQLRSDLLFQVDAGT